MVISLTFRHRVAVLFLPVKLTTQSPFEIGKIRLKHRKQKQEVYIKSRFLHIAFLDFLI